MSTFADVYDWASMVDITEIMRSMSPIWLVGLIIGIITPRQPYLSDIRGLFVSFLGLVLSSHSPWLGRLMTAVNGAVFVQALWYRWTAPGTFHRWMSTVLTRIAGSEKPVTQGDRHVDHDVNGAEQEWFIGERDLEFFRSRVERQDAPVRAEDWRLLIQKRIENVLQYRAFRRMLKDIRKTEYLSISVTTDSTPHEVMDFYLSDPTRQQWDGMLTHCETIKSGDFAKRQQLVHWVRSFPFAFLSDRDYIIARQCFDVDGVLYGISKVVKYHQLGSPGTVRMANYWSMWSCKAVPCPFNSGRPATETTLLHMEDFQISEDLSRLAVRTGMWRFVQKMTPHMQSFIQERRSRGVHPDAADPEAFGAPQGDHNELPQELAAPAPSPRHKKSLPQKIVCTAAAVVLIGLLGRGGKVKTGRQSM